MHVAPKLPGRKKKLQTRRKTTGPNCPTTTLAGSLRGAGLALAGREGEDLSRSLPPSLVLFSFIINEPLCKLFYTQADLYCLGP